MGSISTENSAPYGANGYTSINDHTNIDGHINDNGHTNGINGNANGSINGDASYSLGNGTAFTSTNSHLSLNGDSYRSEPIAIVGIGKPVWHTAAAYLLD